MRKSSLALAVAASVALSGCASFQRVASYTDGQMSTDGKLQVGSRWMSISMHPRDEAVLVQRGIGDGAADGVLRGSTFGIVRGWRPDPRAVDTALARWLGPIQCRSEPVRELGAETGTFEGRITCPAGVSLRRLMADQREALRRGEPIHP